VVENLLNAMEDMENLLDVQVILDVNILKDSKYYIMK